VPATAWRIFTRRSPRHGAAPAPHTDALIPHVPVRCMWRLRQAPIGVCGRLPGAAAWLPRTAAPPVRETSRRLRSALRPAHRALARSEKESSAARSAQCVGGCGSVSPSKVAAVWFGHDSRCSAALERARRAHRLARAARTCAVPEALQSRIVEALPTEEGASAQWCTCAAARMRRALRCFLYSPLFVGSPFSACLSVGCALVQRLQRLPACVFGGLTSSRSESPP
jgi:hypothetical protein